MHVVAHMHKRTHTHADAFLNANKVLKLSVLCAVAF